ncbi:MAG: Ca2+-binding RTX toxin-like protein [Planctomycetaceae bacterium]
MLLAAEIAILGNGVEIVDGDATASPADGTVFPDTPLGGEFNTTFTIQNSGDTTLNLDTTFNSPFADSISNPGAGFFLGAPGPSSTIAANGGTTITGYVFRPPALGTFTATISIASDDADEAVYDFTVMGTAIANTVPTLTPTAAVSAAEGATGVISTVTATDPDAPTFQTLAYSISGGADQAAFSINSSTGALSFANPSAIDFENPTDTGGTAGDNVYQVTVQASDGTASATQTINVSVTDVSVTHTFTLPDASASYTVLQIGNSIFVSNSMMVLLSAVSVTDLTAVTIQGGSGNDTVTLDASLDGNTFALVVNGNNGADAVDGTASTLPVMFIGGSGNDTLAGGGGADVFIGGTGNDAASGGAGNDSLTGSSGSDTLAGDSGNDFVNGNADADFLTGGADNDTILGGAGTDTLDGGAGNDFVNGQGGEADIVAGGGGTDTLMGGASDITLLGPAGVDPVMPPPIVPPVVPPIVPGVLNVALPSSGGSFTVLVNGAMQLQITSTAGTVTETPLANVTSISITGSSNNDAVILDASLAALMSTVSFSGGAGDDSLDSSAVTLNTVFAGGAGNDTLTGGGGNDNFNGGDGDDSATGGAGNDSLTGAAGDDSFSGDAGDDFLNGNSGDDALFGGDGNDTVLGGRGVDLLDGGDGTDVVNGQGGNGDTVAGGGGTGDSLRGDASDILFPGPSGSVPGSPATGGGGVSATSLTVALPSAGGTFNVAVTAVGRIQVTPAAGGAALIDEVFAGLDNIVINGGPGNDVVVLGASLASYSGALAFNGGNGNDSLDSSATSANVTFNGGNGNDTLIGGTGNDTANGGSGNDSISTGAGADSVNAGSGNDTVDAGSGADTVFGAEGADSLIGGAGDDFLNGNSGGDTIHGGDDNDTLLGGAGLDSLNGGLGNDRVRGQGGDPDTVIGGGGIDAISP